MQHLDCFSTCIYLCSNPKTVKNKRGIRDEHLILIVLSLTLVDIIILTTYTIVEGAIVHFSAGVASNKEKPSDIHGVCSLDYIMHTW